MQYPLREKNTHHARRLEHWHAMTQDGGIIDSDQHLCCEQGAANLYHFSGPANSDYFVAVYPSGSSSDPDLYCSPYPGIFLDFGPPSPLDSAWGSGMRPLCCSMDLLLYHETLCEALRQAKLCVLCCITHQGFVSCMSTGGSRKQDTVPQDVFTKCISRMLCMRSCTCGGGLCVHQPERHCLRGGCQCKWRCRVCLCGKPPCLQKRLCNETTVTLQQMLLQVLLATCCFDALCAASANAAWNRVWVRAGVWGVVARGTVQLDGHCGHRSRQSCSA